MSPIACELHDYLEIACLYAYRVRLTLHDGQVIEGVALDTVIRNQQEYLLLDTGEKVEIGLQQLKKLEVLTANAQFSQVNFANNP